MESLAYAGHNDIVRAARMVMSHRASLSEIASTWQVPIETARQAMQRAIMVETKPRLIIDGCIRCNGDMNLNGDGEYTCLQCGGNKVQS